MATLIENMVMENTQIVESDKSKLPEGVLLRVKGRGQTCGVKNANKRIYPKEVWEHVFNNEGWLSKLKNRQMVGEADHPEKNEPSIQRASHVVTNVEWDGGEEIWVTKDILDTPSGRILETLYRAGVKVGTSSRGDGSVRQDEDNDAEIVEVGYMPTTWDAVINPSTPDAYPEPVWECIGSECNQKEIMNAVEGLVNKSHDRKTLLECYSKVSNFYSDYPSVQEARDKVVKQIMESIEREEAEMNEEKQTAPSTSGTTLESMFDSRLREAIGPLEKEVNSLREKVVSKDSELEQQKSNIKEKDDEIEKLQKERDNLQEKLNELNEAAKGMNVKEIGELYEAARTKTIPELLRQNEELQAELKKRDELLEGHTNAAEKQRVNAYIESCLSKYEGKQKEQIRAVLSGCADALEVDQKLEQVENLMGKKEPENRKRQPVTTRPKREAKGRPRGGRERVAESRNRGDSRRRQPSAPKSQPTALSERQNRSQLPKPRNAKPYAVHESGSDKPKEPDVAQGLVNSLSESLGG